MSTNYIRAPGLQDHVLVVPSQAVRDARLSYRARGVLARLLTNSNGFSSTAETLSHEGKEGRDAIRKALRELQATGYLVRHGRKNECGQWIGTDVYVYDVPQPEPNGKPENPLAGFPTLKSSKSINEVISEKSSAQERPHTGGGGAAGENP